MPRIDLSTLPAQELRQLLHSVRQRGQAAQSYEILQEMETRRARGEPVAPKRLRRRAARGSHTIVLDLGDPLDRPDPDDAAISDPEPPLRLAEPQPEAPPAARLPTRRPRWGHWAALCFALGLGGGVAAGWWAADGGSWNQPAPVQGERAAPAPRRPLPVVVADATATPAPAANLGPTPAPAAAPADPAPPPAATAQAEASEPAAKLEVAVAQPAASETPACSAEPTPADQTICGASRLRRLQADLRHAYAEALQAHEDRSLLRQRQLAWRDGRNAVTDPEQLARIYERRIAQLRAAAMDAARQREGAAHGSQRG